MCDTGSMITVLKKGQNDKIDRNKTLQAVNGSKIDCYGQKEIKIRIGRKEYDIKAIIADVEQDIIGWDFFAKHKLSLQWGNFGDLYIYDKKSQTGSPLKYVTVEANSVPQSAYLLDSSSSDHLNWSSPDTMAFEVASMKSL